VRDAEGASGILPRSAEALRAVRYGLRVAHRLAPAELLRGRLVVRLDGLRLEVPPDRIWAYRGGTYYERNVHRRWLEALRGLGQPVVYDAGAHAGFYSLTASPLASEVHAFEPSPATFALLERNLARNDARNVTARRLALGDEEGEVELRLYSASGNNSLVGRALPHLRPRGRASVEAATLDGLVEAGLPPPGLVKLDIEGSELRALRGARAVLGRHRPVVFMEFWAQGAENAGHSLEDLAGELETHGYTLLGLSEHLDDATLHPRSRWHELAVGNVVAVPPDAAGLFGPG
jgi:FkbM family methyltransferase